MNKNSLDTNFILFDRFKTSNNSPIIDFINSKEDIINKNYRILINVGNEKLNWDKVFKIKKTKEYIQTHYKNNSQLPRTPSCPNNIKYEKKNKLIKSYKLSSDNLLNHVHHNKKEMYNYSNNTLNNTTLKSNNSINCLSPSTIASTPNESNKKISFFITSENSYQKNKMKNIKQLLLTKNIINSKLVSYISSKKLSKSNSENKLKVKKLDLSKINKSINKTLSFSKILENSIDDYIKTTEIKKTNNKPILFQEIDKINQLFNKNEIKKYTNSLKTLLFNKKTKRAELIEINNANLIKYSDYINHMKDSKIGNWGKKFIKKYQFYEKKANIKLNYEENEKNSNKREFLRNQLMLNSFRLNKKVENIIREKKKIKKGF